MIVICIDNPLQTGIQLGSSGAEGGRQSLACLVQQTGSEQTPSAIKRRKESAQVDSTGRREGLLVVGRRAAAAAVAFSIACSLSLSLSLATTTVCEDLESAATDREKRAREECSGRTEKQMGCSNRFLVTRIPLENWSHIRTTFKAYRVCRSTATRVGW